MSVDLGSAHGRIEIDASGVERGVGAASRSLTAFEASARGIGSTIASAGVAFAAAGAAAGGALALGLGAAVAKAADFEAQMSAVAANAGATAEELLALREAALSAGAETAFSASEAAAAMDELVKAGVAVGDILGGGLRGTLALAAAGGLDLASAAEIAANAMNIFGLAGADVGHIADLLAAAANASAVSVQDIGASFTQAGTVANQFGQSIEETTAVLAAFGAQGIKGSDAGTSLRTMLLSLVNPTKEAQQVMRDLGLEFFRADGTMKGFGEIAGVLQTQLAGLTDEQRAAALEVIFGSDAIRAATVLYGEGADGIAEWLTQVNRQGAAAENAATRMDNLKGSIEEFRGAVETAAIRVGAAFIPLVRDIVDGAADLVRAVTNSERAMGALDAVVAAAQAALARLRQELRRVVALLPQLARIGRAFAGIGEAIRTGLKDDFLRDFGRAVEAAFGPGVAQLAAAFAERLTRALQLVRDGILTARQAFAGEWTSAPQIQGAVRALGEIATAAGNLWRALRRLGAAFAAAITPERAAILRRLWQDFLDLQGAINGIRVAALVAGLDGVARAVEAIAPGLAAVVGWLIDFAGRAQAGGREADILRAALVLLGAWVATNKLADLVGTLRSIATQAAASAGQVGALWRELTRGPRLVVTTIRTIYETVGQAAQAVGGVVVRTVRVAFATAQDALIWGQLYAEQAAQTITRQIRTVYEALPTPPTLPALIQKVIPQIDTTGIGATLPTLTLPVQPQITVGVSFGQMAADLGAKLAGGMAAGIGAAIGGALVASGALAAIGSALLAALPYILAALAVVAVAAAGFFLGQLVYHFVQQSGGIGPALARIFLDAVPFALGAVAGLLVNAGLQMTAWILQGLAQGIPALIGFIQSNFQQVLVTIGLVLAPLPTLVLLLLNQIIPHLQAFGARVGTIIGEAFAQVGTIVSAALGALGGIVQSAIGGVVAVVQAVGGQLLGAVQAAFAPLGAAIRAIIEGDWGAAILAGIQFIVNLFVTLPAQILGILTGGFAQVVGVIVSALGQAQAAVVSAFGQIVGVVLSAGGQIVAAVGSAFQSVLTTITGALANIRSAIEQALASFVRGFQSTFNVELVAEVNAGMAALKAAIGSGLEAAVTLIASLPGRAAAALGNIGSVLFNAGASLVQGFIDGILSKIGAVQGALAGLTNMLPEWKGPPEKDRRILRPSGRWVIEGFVAGIEDRIPAVIRAAEDVTGALADGIGQGAQQVGAAVTSLLEALSALAAFDFAANSPSGETLGWFRHMAESLVANLAQVAALIGDEGLKQADAAAQALSGVGAGVKSAVEALGALAEFDFAARSPTGDTLGWFRHMAESLVLTIAEAAALVGPGRLAQAQTFAEALGRIAQAVSGALQTFGEIVGGAGEEAAAGWAFEDVALDFGGGLDHLAGVATLAERYRQVAETIRSALVAAAETLGEAFGALGLGGGATAGALLAAGGTTTVVVRQERVVSHTVTMLMPADDGQFVARSLRVDGKSRGEVAGMIAEEILTVAPGA